MHLFIFVSTFVINFSVYQAELLSHEVERLNENGPSNQRNGGTTPTYGNQNLNAGQSRTNFFDGYNGYSNSQGASSLDNRFGSNVPHGVDNSNTKTTRRTDGSAYRHISDGQNEITDIGNGYNKNNVFFITERSRDNPTGFIPRTGTNTGRGPNNNEGIPNTQRASNLGNRFGSDVPHGLDNSFPKSTRTAQSIYTHISDGPNDIIHIGNGQNKNNVFYIDERSPGRGNLPTTNFNGKYPNPIDVPLGNRFGSDGPQNFYPWSDSSQNRRVQMTNIGNGVGNHNTFFINENGDGEKRTTAVFPPNYDNRRRINTQQSNYKPRTNSWSKNTRTNFNQGGNVPTYVNTFTSIGRGLGNRNTVIIDGKPTRFDSGLSIATREYQGRGDAATCQLNGTCRLPVWGVPGLKRKLGNNHYWFARSHRPSERSQPNFFKKFRKLFNKLNWHYK